MRKNKRILSVQDREVLTAGNSALGCWHSVAIGNSKLSEGTGEEGGEVFALYRERNRVPSKNGHNQVESLCVVQSTCQGTGCCSERPRQAEQ